MNKRTKIVATIGPATESEEIIEQLIHSGMNVARFNTKHGTPEWHQERMKRVRKVSKKLGIPVGILIDLQGPEIRINVPNGTGFDVKMGEKVLFSSAKTEVLKDSHAVEIPQAVIDSLSKGDTVLVDDGLGEFEIVSKRDDELIARALGSFPVGHRKTLNTPGVEIDLPSLISADKVQLDGVSNDLIDFVGLSFVRKAVDIKILKKELKKRNLSPSIVSKIENQAAIDNLNEILDVSDAVMIARGDLAVEVPFKKLAYLQKVIIKKCRNRAIPVITATQMLKSMVDNPRPTRAEVTDVANAVYDGTDAVMLSEETTIGKFPVEAVATQASIVEFNELHAKPCCRFDADQDFTSSITHAVSSLLENSAVNVDQIITLTESGRSVRLVSRLRSSVPIIGITRNEGTFKQLTLNYGVIPQLVDYDQGMGGPEKLLKVLKKRNLVKEKDIVLFIHGKRWKTSGLTNTVSILKVE